MAFSSHPLPLANHPFSLKIDMVATDIKKKKGKLGHVPWRTQRTESQAFHAAVRDGGG